MSVVKVSSSTRDDSYGSDHTTTSVVGQVFPVEYKVLGSVRLLGSNSVYDPTPSPERKRGFETPGHGTEKMIDGSQRCVERLHGVCKIRCNLDQSLQSSSEYRNETKGELSPLYTRLPRIST